MKVHILDAKKQKKGDVTLPPQFSEPVREDLIKRAVHALQANARQPYGADPMAGKYTSAELSRRRRKYRGSYGKGISRVPRKILNRRGSQMYMVGAFAPGTVGGRRAHAPKAEKNWAQKVNVRENRKAIRSALAATINPEIVRARGHKIPTDYPFVVEGVESLKKTAQVEVMLDTLGFGDDLDRATKTKIRAGKATYRGRKTQRPTSLLIVTGGDVPLLKSGANVAGVNVVQVNAINAELLAPGTHPGRATLFTTEAMKVLDEKKLFMDTGKKPKAAKPVAEDAKIATKAKKPAKAKSTSKSKTTSSKPQVKEAAKSPAKTEVEAV